MSRAAMRLAGLERRAKWVPVLAAVAAVLAFLPSLATGFVFDDVILIADNPFAHDLGHVPRCFGTDLWDTPARPDRTASVLFYRPLVCASYAVNWVLAGGRPWAFHAVNVALHAGATALVAMLGRRWTGSAVLGLLAALAFAVHPTRTENVVWISGRTDVLMAVLLLSGHELAVRAATRAGPEPWRWAAAALCWTGAILSKEFAVCFVLFLAAEASGFREDPRVARRLWKSAALGLLLTGVYLAVRASVFPIRPPEIEEMALPPPLRVGYVLLTVGFYFERLLLPWPQTFHFRPVAVVDGAPVLSTPSVVLGAVVVLGVLAWLVVAWRRSRREAAPLLLAVVLMAPVANVSYTGFPGTTADRFLYLPLIPIAVSVTIALGPTLRRWSARSALAPLVVASAVVLASAVSWVRTLDYSSERALWSHELTLNPHNPQALASLAALEAKDGEPGRAFALLQRALEPRSLQYRLLATPGMYYAGLVQLHALRLADGHVAALEALLTELQALTEQPPRTTGARSADLELTAPREDEHWRVHVANRRSHLLVAAALVASRLGKGAEVVRLAARASPLDALADADRMNLALALGRVGEVERARAELGRVAAPALAGRLAELLRSAQASPPEGEPLQGAIARAARAMRLGSYLLAARELRRAYRRHPHHQPLVEQYIEALAWCRLDHEAARIADEAPDPAAARAVLARAQAEWSPRTRAALAPGPGGAW